MTPRVPFASALVMLALAGQAFAQEQRPDDGGRPYIGPSQTTLQAPPWETARTRAPTKSEAEDAMKTAPGALTRAGIACTVIEAGVQPKVKLADGKKASVYEAACQEGLGYIVVVPGKADPMAVNCLIQDADNAEAAKADPEAAKGRAACALPANAPSLQLGRLLLPSGAACQSTGGRFVGANAAGVSYYEVTCQGAEGLMLGVKRDKIERSLPCSKAAAIGGGCTLTSPG